MSPVVAQEVLDPIIVYGAEQITADPDYDAQNNTFVKNKVMGGQDLLTIPTTVDVIDRERFNLDTVNFTEETEDLLTRVPGMSGSRNLRVDCGWCDYTVNLQNGLAMRPLGSGNYNFDSANNFDIERIEIIKGPASALYPSHAFGAVIDVITKRPPETPEARLFGDVGSWGRERAGFSLGGTENNLGFLIDGYTYKLDGWGVGRAENKSSLSARANYDLSPQTSIQFGGSATHDYQQSPDSLTQQQWDEDWGQETDFSVSRTDTRTADTIVEHRFSDSFTMKMAYGYVWEEGKTSRSNSIDERHDLKPRFTKDFNFWDSQLITGLDYSHDENERLGSSGTMTTADIVSPYAQYAFSPFTGVEFLRPLKFSLGARYETFDYAYSTKAGIDGSKKVEALTPHLGASYRLNANNSLWASYSEGISVPGASRMFPTSSSRKTYEDNPNLEPEEATNFEFGLRGNIWGGKLAYDVGWHDLEISNFIIEQELTDDVFQYQNVGGVSIKGVEAQLAYWPVEWVGVEMAYTYGDHKFTDYVLADGTDYSGMYMRRSMKHRLNTRFVAKPIEGSKIELEWDYNSPAYINYDNTQTYKRPDLFHLSGSYELNEIITVWGQVRNLTDVKYASRVTADDGADGEREYEVGLPRSFAIGVSGKLKF